MPSDFAEVLRRELPGTRWLNEIGLAFMSSKVLATAIELELFTTLAERPLTVAAIADRLSIKPDLAGRLLTACCALGFVQQSDGRFSNSEDVAKYLVKGQRSYFGGYLLQFIQERYPLWERLEETIKSGEPIFDGEYYRRLHEDPVAVRQFTEGGYTGSIATGHMLAKRFDFSTRSLLLDLGGGSGAYCIAAASRNPNLRAIVFDHPNVLAVAKEFIAAAGLSDRITTYAGDFVSDDYPSGADVILIASNLHFYNPDDARKVFGKAFAALSPGGALIWIDYMLDDDRGGPLVPAMIELSQCFWVGDGRVYTGAEIRQMMAEVGFIDLAVDDFVPGQLGRVVGHKP